MHSHLQALEWKVQGEAPRSECDGNQVFPRTQKPRHPKQANWGGGSPAAQTRRRPVGRGRGKRLHRRLLPGSTRARAKLLSRVYRRLAVAQVRRRIALSGGAYLMALRRFTAAFWKAASTGGQERRVSGLASVELQRTSLRIDGNQHGAQTGGVA
ncbi:hypothetical protein TGP89_281530 [Toxoplasma gondii p89]|uniref:Uncharacterized protein n=2 Tax=Toxoplasma gondii TaxID=5811 RepID=A0A2T6IFF3_TOXGO|nr:hypothetical protein TGP89_281530 [Toxoplasma gondii p89]PUA84055.1 hypothetical protein TGBR9_281530 [Toxoplasma gondii TgCATBr9]